MPACRHAYARARTHSYANREGEGERFFSSYCSAGRTVQASSSYGPWVPPPLPLSLQLDAACQPLAGAARRYKRQCLPGFCATDIVLVTLSSTAVETAIAQCTSRWAMARGHRLNTSIVLAAVHGLSGLFRAVSAVEPFTLSPPSHSVPVLWT